MALHAACNGPNIVEDPHVKFLENRHFDEAREVADAVISLEIAWCIFRKLFSGSNTLNTCSQWNITITTNCIWMFPKIVVPPNRPILIIINHPFWGTPIFGNTQIYIFDSIKLYTYKSCKKHTFLKTNVENLCAQHISKIYSPRLSSLHSTFLMNWNIHHMKRYLINVFARSMQHGLVIKSWNQKLFDFQVVIHPYILKKFPIMEPISNDHNDKKELYLEKTQKIHV